MGRTWFAILLTLATWDSAVHAQADRRDRKLPDLVVETGGRMGTCDVLTFTPDGKDLLAVGDDKVVRIWPCGETGLDRAGAKILRWSSWREDRGQIYAVALSPDKENRQVAVAGLGMRIGTVMVLERATGKVLHALTDTKGSQAVIRSLAFSPTGKQVAFGTEYGGVWVWDVTKDHGVRLDQPPKKDTVNRVRLVSFRDENTLLSVAEDGKVLGWDVRKPGREAREVLAIGVKQKLYRVILSHDGQWLAAGTQGPLIALRSLDGKQRKDIELTDNDFVRSIAFDPQGQRLAAGIGNDHPDSGFYNERDDTLVVYDLTPQQPRRQSKWTHTYHAEALAFHPDGKRLAIAGGNDHDVTLWDLSQREKPLSQIRGAGACLWSVALSENGRYLAFRDQREPNPKSLNQRAKGSWRAFDLELRRWTPVDKLKLLEARDRADGYSVKPNPYNPYHWTVLHTNGKSHPLPFDRVLHGMPRCYTFLPAKEGKPTRLIVGHYYGFSIYELTGDAPRLSRQCRGHQGEVMSLAVSADQKWMVSASTDQTISAWSLDDWPSQPELGARFVVKNGKLLVDVVDAGSPSWEAGLIAGDEVTLLAVRGEKVEGGPSDWLKRLRQPEPGRELYFGLRRGKQEMELATTVRQRPLWRFFPTRDHEWILWMWQGYYYDTSTNGDSLIGWHLNNEDLDREPSFYKADQFRKHFHRPDVIDQLLATRKVVDSFPKDRRPVDFGLMEPPAVRMELTAKEVVGDEVKVTLIATPRGKNPDHQPQQVDFWINDFRFRTWEADGQPFRQEIAIPRALLRNGVNDLTLQTYDRLKGRSEVTATVINRLAAPEKPRVFGRFFGINDYGKSLPAPGGKRLFNNLKSACKDVEVMQQRWQRQKDKLYQDAQISLNVDKEVSRETLLRDLRGLAKQVRPDDLLVVYLSGHGDLHQKGDTSTFVFCCPDYDRERFDETGVTSVDIYEALAALPCRKLVFLDACRSGGLAINPVRSLTPGGKGPTIFAACDPSQPSYEHEKFGHGVFTYAILDAMDRSFARADENGDGKLDAAELYNFLQVRMPELLKEIDREDLQHPICFPREPERYPLVQK